MNAVASEAIMANNTFACMDSFKEYFYSKIRFDGYIRLSLRISWILRPIPPGQQYET